MIKSASQIYEEFQPIEYGCGAYILPEDWMILAMKAYAEQALDLAIENTSIEDNNFHPVITKDELTNLKQQLK